MGDAKGDGAYFTPRIRGDLTIDFRSSLDLKAEGSYSYLSNGGATTVTGSVTDKVRINNAVALANLYWDVLPRGFFTPYVGAGIGLVYFDAPAPTSTLPQPLTALRKRRHSAARIRASRWRPR